MKRALRRRYGHTASGGVRAALVGYMFQDGRVKVSFCERQLEKWLPIANVSKSTLDQAM